MNNSIESSNVILRPITKNDTKYIVAWRNNTKVKRNFIFQEQFTDDIHNNWLDNIVNVGLAIQYIIEIKQTGKPIGSVYFRDIDKKNNTAEFGIFIGDDKERGCGYGTEATEAFIKYGLCTLKFHRIFLRVFANNSAAISTYKNAGFKQEGIFKDMVKIDDSYKDIIFMAIINNE
jgi:RimJ/RimL family protein N-acetyltransferase